MTRTIWLTADDYGISPAVDDGILELLEAGRLSGTGCMTLFPEWKAEAKRLRPHAGKAGLHLTLTDQQALTGNSNLARNGTLPGFAALAAGIATGGIAAADIQRELDAQYAAFTDAMGQAPAYIDGHQHVHFLPPVRRWLRQLTARGGPLPWLRGAPTTRLSPMGSKARIATVRTLATRFDRGMRKIGYVVHGPLAGFYDWTSSQGFAPTIEHALKSLPDSGVLMCHPGKVDAVLRSRDPLTDTRAAELAWLASDRFATVLADSGATLA